MSNKATIASVGGTLARTMMEMDHARVGVVAGEVDTSRGVGSAPRLVEEVGEDAGGAGGTISNEELELLGVDVVQGEFFLGDMLKDNILTKRVPGLVTA